MNPIIIEHVPLEELPPAWRARLPATANARVTVRIEEEVNEQAAPLADNPLFGMWKDRDELVDVDGYVRELRASRYNADGSRRKE